MTYKKANGIGDLGTWIGSIGTVIALLLVVWQVKESEETLRHQNELTRAREIEDHRPHLKLNIVTLKGDANLTNYWIPIMENNEDETLSKKIKNDPVGTSFISVTDVLGKPIIDLSFYCEYCLVTKSETFPDMFWTPESEEQHHKKFILGPLKKGQDLYIAPPTTYLKNNNGINVGNGKDMDNTYYSRIVLKFTTDKGETGFAEAINSDSFFTNGEGLLEKLTYYFIQGDALTKAYGSDTMIRQDNKKVNDLENLFIRSDA
ncbi:hypothetical protein DCM90_01345 [Levilactobacillus bambusae]|uniref:Uncharacterized protein n=1 Tax=Levilactobacillus bambusae TaxID=2024736 RepID=A0A2V1N0P8_9LACO|nr:hypothetical protein DCM90_01345 [Levilactobacillus bambusae]